MLLLSLCPANPHGELSNYRLHPMKLWGSLNSALVICHCCVQILDRSNLRGGDTYLGSCFQGYNPSCKEHKAAYRMEQLGPSVVCDLFIFQEQTGKSWAVLSNATPNGLSSPLGFHSLLNQHHHTRAKGSNTNPWGNLTLNTQQAVSPDV